MAMYCIKLIIRLHMVFYLFHLSGVCQMPLQSTVCIEFTAAVCFVLCEGWHESLLIFCRLPTNC